MITTIGCCGLLLNNEDGGLGRGIRIIATLAGITRRPNTSGACPATAQTVLWSSKAGAVAIESNPITFETQQLFSIIAARAAAVLSSPARSPNPAKPEKIGKGIPMQHQPTHNAQKNGDKTLPGGLSMLQDFSRVFRYAGSSRTHICTALGSPDGCAAISCNLSSAVLMCPMPETFTLEDRLLICTAL